MTHSTSSGRGVIRTRIAPSPTGYLHIGNARAALFSYLYAKKHGGTFILRIEDTDIARSKKEYEDDIFREFAWLGIHPDEGPEQGGPYGPYRDSERGESTRRALEKLLNEKKAFYCFHEKSELAASEGSAEGKFEAHVCSYRELSRAEAEAKIQNGEQGIIRFKNDSRETISFSDLVRGAVSFEAPLLGDFSLARTIDQPLYNFAVTIDDAEMKISHVIRGEDHIANTPKQILIQRALGYPEPQWAHLPLILGSDRAKLSKRHGATSVKEFREAGYLPEALINFLAFLGWNPGGDRELFSLEELAKEFDLDRVQKSGAIWNQEKLGWFNAEYIRRRDRVSLVPLAQPFLQQKFPDHIISTNNVEAALFLEQSRLVKLADIGEESALLFREPEYDTALLRWKDMTDEDVRAALHRAGDLVETIPGKLFADAVSFEDRRAGIEKHFFDALGAGSKGKILWPLRVALSGKKASPGPFEIITVLNRETAIHRIHRAIAKL
ncbi:glutamate--tRNA ligase [Candidatus Parcubacteria bacterium]|nr:MAG: glutamate--tRNA ligase [Candidatus Parcubacteria bacterium]